jgi:hypothetical protein
MEKPVCYTAQKLALFPKNSNYQGDSLGFGAAMANSKALDLVDFVQSHLPFF